MPSTLSSATSSSTASTTWAVVLSAGRSRRNESMPTWRQRFTFILTYVCEAGSSPTSTVASRGVRPVVSR